VDGYLKPQRRRKWSGTPFGGFVKPWGAEPWGSNSPPKDVNRKLKIDWAGTFLPKHRKGNPGGYTVLFVRVERGVYRLA